MIYLSISFIFYETNYDSLNQINDNYLLFTNNISLSL